ncbi:hypothetical protein DFJ58DRAFT_726277 [Suillus subalutaceus]|uniref:uncharacterized protein n=1 Tax=Suillus subalutaceus TaxID=48586 RepID=UPI001B878815|nr:uncharacterized protein DFJ58DRAFT_726277 [Suillus subalutaceus]KAG1859559.1 hypothetical protein DFJ58DRAFT_726277 [Suillus subalutaceus]
MSAAELQSMRTELERLRKAECVEANKTAEVQKKIESRKLAAHRLSQETEEEESSQPSSPKRIRRNPPTDLIDDDLDEDEEVLARSLPPVVNSKSRSRRIDSDEEDQDQDQSQETESHDKNKESVSNTEDNQESRGENGEEGNNNGISINEEGPPTGKRKRSPNGTRKEQVTLSILEKSIRDLAIAGHDYLRMYIATQNTFPDSTTKASFSWKRLEEAVASRKELKQLMEQESKVVKTKEMLIDYMWKGVSSMRGNGMKRDDIVEAVEWMLKDLKKVRKGGEGEDDISLPLFLVTWTSRRRLQGGLMKMREEMYQNVLEESNMTYLLHIEDDGEGEGGNGRQEGKIDVDYDALEVSAA